MKRFTEIYIILFITIAMIALVVSASALKASAAVTVYAEGAYTENDLVVYIYADIDTEALCSGGVKLSFNNGYLALNSAEKNEDVWFMGDGSTNRPYMDPENAGDGVIFICGKLDTADPTAGVIGDRVLLGKVSFTRNDGGATPVTDPESYFGITLDLGRGGSYVNFVTTGGTPMDGVVDFTTKGVIVRERGDANADGVINVQDIGAVSYVIANGAYTPPVPWKDCNGDEAVNVQDISCVSYAIAH